jgi:hypothetical protein
MLAANLQHALHGLWILLIVIFTLLTVLEFMAMDCKVDHAKSRAFRESYLNKMTLMIQLNID